MVSKTKPGQQLEGVYPSVHVRMLNFKAQQVSPSVFGDNLSNFHHFVLAVLHSNQCSSFWPRLVLELVSLSSRIEASFSQVLLLVYGSRNSRRSGGVPFKRRHRAVSHLECHAGSLHFLLHVCLRTQEKIQNQEREDAREKLKNGDVGSNRCLEMVPKRVTFQTTLKTRANHLNLAMRKILKL